MRCGCSSSSGEWFAYTLSPLPNYTSLKRVGVISRNGANPIAVVNTMEEAITAAYPAARYLVCAAPCCCLMLPPHPNAPRLPCTATRLAGTAACCTALSPCCLQALWTPLLHSSSPEQASHALLARQRQRQSDVMIRITGTFLKIACCLGTFMTRCRQLEEQQPVQHRDERWRRRGS